MDCSVQIKISFVQFVFVCVGLRERLNSHKLQRISLATFIFLVGVVEDLLQVVVL